MKQVPYIDYGTLAEFYTVQQLADLLGMKKPELKENCEAYDIKPRKNEIGDYGFVRYDVRKLHNALYHESRGSTRDGSAHREDDPWA